MTLYHIISWLEAGKLRKEARTRVQGVQPHRSAQGQTKVCIHVEPLQCLEGSHPSNQSFSSDESDSDQESNVVLSSTSSSHLHNTPFTAPLMFRKYNFHTFIIIIHLYSIFICIKKFTFHFNLQTTDTCGYSV